MNKQETKYALTAQKMDEALLELLSEKEFPFIAVKEICQRAKVNRSTFYLHYQTINDLLLESLELVNHRFTDYFNTGWHTFSHDLSSGNKGELYFITPEYLHPYLFFIKDNKRLFQTVAKQPEALQAHQTYQRMFEHILKPIMNCYGVAECDQRYMMSFYIHGIIAVVEEWLDADCADSIDSLASLIQRCIKKPEVKERPQETTGVLS